MNAINGNYETTVNVSDALRDLSNVLQPDARSPLPAVPGAGGLVSGGLEIHLAEIQRYRLRPEVPVGIRIHFETAKNLYLYAWFVYRFYMAADQYVYSTLELALRTRLHPDLADDEWKPMLRKMLDEAIDQGLLSKRKFSRVVLLAKARARSRQSRELIDRMNAGGLKSVQVSDDVEILEEDYAFDALDIWKDNIPYSRNLHAHGTTSLWPSVLTTFEIVSEMINQLYEPQGECP